MKIGEIYHSVSSVFCSVLRYGAELNWALRNNWLELTISNLFFIIVIFWFLVIGISTIYYNLREGFFAYRDEKTGAVTRDKSELAREREKREDTYASSLAILLTVIILFTVISEISDKYIGREC